LNQVGCEDFILGAAPRALKQGLAWIAAILARYTDKAVGEVFGDGGLAGNSGGLAGFGCR
jgi:hypothetical protein